jgi:hypothetical protein
MSPGGSTPIPVPPSRCFGWPGFSHPYPFSLTMPSRGCWAVIRYSSYGHPLPPRRSTWQRWSPFASSSFDMAAMATVCLLVLRRGGYGHRLPPRRSTWRLQPRFVSSFNLAAMRTVCLLVVRLGGDAHHLPPRRSTWRLWPPFASSLFDLAAMGTICLFVVRIGSDGSLLAINPSGALGFISMDGGVRVWNLVWFAMLLGQGVVSKGMGEMRKTQN